MKRIILNLTLNNKNFLQTFHNISKYYWNKKTFETEYYYHLPFCVKNAYVKMFPFINKNLLLEEACELGKLNVVKYLIEKQNISLEEDPDNIPMRTAISFGRLKIVKYLMSQGFVFDSLYDTALWLATESGDIKMVKFIAKQNIYKPCSHSLIDAVRFKNYDIARFLIEQKLAETNRSDLLKIAVVNEDLEMVKLLVQNGIKTGINNIDLIRICCSEPLIEIAKFLLENGANIAKRNYEALFLASCYGYTELVEYLVNFNITFEGLKRALKGAAKNNRFEVIKILTEHNYKNISKNDISKILFDTTICNDDINNYLKIKGLL